MTPWHLERDAFGRLQYAATPEAPRQVVVPVRAFPLTAPREGIALVGDHGEECAWIENLDDLAVPLRSLIEDSLTERDFMPALRRIVRVSSFATPSTWVVETDQGQTELVLRGEEDIRRLAGPALLIADSHGLHYRIEDRWALDRESRRLLDRFL